MYEYTIFKLYFKLILDIFIENKLFKIKKLAKSKLKGNRKMTKTNNIDYQPTLEIDQSLNLKTNKVYIFS